MQANTFLSHKTDESASIKPGSGSVKISIYIFKLFVVVRRDGLRLMLAITLILCTWKCPRQVEEMLLRIVRLQFVKHGIGRLMPGTGAWLLPTLHTYSVIPTTDSYRVF